MLDLRGGERRVDRDGYGPGPKDGQIGSHPLRAILRKDGYPIPRFDSKIQQPQGSLFHQNPQLIPGDVAILSALLDLQGWPGAVAGGLLLEHPG